MQELQLFRKELGDAAGTSDLRLHSGFSQAVVEIASRSDHLPHLVVWTAESQDFCRLTISPLLSQPSRIAFFARRLGALWPILSAYHKSDLFSAGQVNLNLDDISVGTGLGFCGRSRANLIPDAIFMKWRGYAETRLYFASGGISWEERIPQAIWRGATTGRRSGDWRTLPRSRLCEIALSRPDFIDAGITDVVQLPAEAASEIRSAGLLREKMPVREFGRWRYQIDIDGNSNSWPGLFQKLLSGSPVLKVASEGGWQQWYYDRLRPWENFVPVENDMSDLCDKITWLRANDCKAVEIGQSGKRLADELTYESQIVFAVNVIRSVME